MTTPNGRPCAQRLRIPTATSAGVRQTPGGHPLGGSTRTWQRIQIFVAAIQTQS